MADRAATPGVSVDKERLDDIPVIVNMLEGLGIPSQVDQFIKSHGNWQGVSAGQLVLSWLSYIVFRYRPTRCNCCSSTRAVTLLFAIVRSP